MWSTRSVFIASLCAMTVFNQQKAKERTENFVTSALSMYT